MNASIRAVGAYLPPKRVTNDDLAKTIDTSDEWIRSHTGIGARHIAADDKTTADLAVEAALAALKNGGLAPEELDLIILSTSTSDYVAFPATASLVQHRIGARCGAFDLAAACTGFVYAMECARGFIAAGTAKKVMVIGAEKLSAIVNWQDRSTCVLFGDGAGAVIVEACGEDHGFLASRLLSDGSGEEALILRAGGIKQPIDENTSYAERCIEMDGRRVYNFAVQANTDLIRGLLDDAGLSIDQVKYIVPHQANIRIILAAAKRAGIPEEKFYLNIEEYANTSAASIPIALNDLWRDGKLESGDVIMTLGFGAGLTSGGQILRI